MFVNELHVMLINGNESLDSDQKYVKIQLMEPHTIIGDLSAFPSWIDVNCQFVV